MLPPPRARGQRQFGPTSKNPRSRAASGEFFHNFFLVEWVGRRAPNLICLVPLSREQHDVGIGGEVYRALYGSQSVCDALVIPSLHSGFNVVDDRVGVLGPRIVAGDDRVV